MRCFPALLSTLIVLSICAEAQAGKHAAVIAGNAAFQGNALLDAPRSDAAASAAASWLARQARAIEISLIPLDVCRAQALEPSLAASRLQFDCDLLAQNDTTPSR